MSRTEPGRAFGRAVRARGALLAVLLQLATGCSLVRPPHARELVQIGYRSPEHVFQSFQTALAADLPDQEFRCFSYDFRRREGLSFNSYLEGRKRLLKERPWMTLVAKAEIVRSESSGERAHLLVGEIHGRQFAVELVRQDVFEMWAGRDLLADGPVDFDRDVLETPERGAQGLAVRALIDPLDYPRRRPHQRDRVPGGPGVEDRRPVHRPLGIASSP